MAAKSILKNAFKVGGKSPSKSQAAKAVSSGDARWITISGRRVLVKSKGSGAKKGSGSKAKKAISKKKKSKSKKSGGVGAGTVAAGLVGGGLLAAGGVALHRKIQRDRNNARLKDLSKNLALGAGVVGGLNAASIAIGLVRAAKVARAAGKTIKALSLTRSQRVAGNAAGVLGLSATLTNFSRTVGLKDKAELEVTNQFRQIGSTFGAAGASVFAGTALTAASRTGGVSSVMRAARNATEAARRAARSRTSATGFSAARTAKNVTPAIKRITGRTSKLKFR